MPCYDLLNGDFYRAISEIYTSERYQQTIMYRTSRFLFIVCETPLHAGSGDSLGVVDLPIQRERHTSFPKIESSSLKGAIRQSFEELSLPDRSSGKYRLSGKAFSDDDTGLRSMLDEAWGRSGSERSGDEADSRKDKNGNTLTRYQEAVTLAFGPEDAGTDAHAGALGLSDARLLLFPVKSMKGVFAWVTCPKILLQFKKDMALTGSPYPYDLPERNTVPKHCSLFVRNASDKRIVLEEFTFTVSEDNDRCSQLGKWLSDNASGDNYWKEKMKRDIVVLSNEDFTDFVNLSTEVITRTKIDNKSGTVAQGQLFTEEYLPAESVMYSLVLASPIFKERESEKGVFRISSDNPFLSAYDNEESKVMEFFKKALPDVIQVGGNATLGKGLVRTKVL